MVCNDEFSMILTQIEKDKNIKKQDILTVIKNALISAYKKHVGKNVNVEAGINPKNGEMVAKVIKVVVKKVNNPLLEICLQDANKFDQNLNIGSEIKIPLNIQDFSRIASQTAKQIIVQKIKESERVALLNEMKEKVGQIVDGFIHRISNKAYIVDLGKTEAILPISEQIFREKFTIGQHIKAIIVKVDENTRNSFVVLSRSRPEFVKRLFESEVPEIYEKIVEIANIVRFPGIRTKIAVLSHNPKVDPVGACVGVRGARVKPIIDELKGEKIDLISYSIDAVKYISGALSPVKVISVNIISQKENKAEVLVSDDKLSLAIGRNGHNVRLAAKLTGWHIDVKSELQKKVDNNVQISQEIEIYKKLDKLSKKTIKKLIDAGFRDIEKINNLKIDDLIALPGIGQKTAKKIVELINIKQ
ncbi:MAG: transcription termination factor NusA [Endomicrobium sp.]|jgi:N utilization substance protein A|nr:transcription termination factor NusA [Endomicrobium sp.]